MLQIKKLLQIKQSCCKFKIVAANFQTELLQIKRMTKYFMPFSGYFIINFSLMCLRDQIFRVLLEHFISEVVSK